MGISKAAFASVLASLIVMTTGPARAYDFSKPLSCAVTVYRGGSAMWTWVDVVERERQSRCQGSRTRHDERP